MSNSTAEQLLPKLIKLAAAKEAANPNYSSLLIDSALANVNSLTDQDSHEKLSHLQIESLEAMIRNATKHVSAKLGEGSVGSSPIDQRSHSNSPTINTVPNGSQTAVISLQASQSDTGATATALLASEDFQHLLSNGGNVSSSSSVKQFFLLVPSDVPVIVPPSTAAQGNCSLEQQQQQETFKCPDLAQSGVQNVNSWTPRRRNSSAVHCLNGQPLLKQAKLMINPSPSTQSQQAWTGANNSANNAAACMAAYLAQQQQQPSSTTAAAVRRASVIGTVHERQAGAVVADSPSRNIPNFSNEILNETRNIRRRVSHNEVERRRRDRINTWIGELQKLLPADEQAKSHYQSKGLVLKRVWEYFQNVEATLKGANKAIQELQSENQQLKLCMAQHEQEKQIFRNNIMVVAQQSQIETPSSSGDAELKAEDERQ